MPAGRVRFAAHLIVLHEAQLRQGAGWPDEQQENERRHAEAKEQLKAFPEDWNNGTANGRFDTSATAKRVHPCDRWVSL